MEDFKFKLIHLHHCRGIGWKTILNILKADPGLKQLYNLSVNDFPHQNSTVTTPASILHDLQSDFIPQQIRQYQLKDISMITIFDDEYPELLKEIYQPPWVLYGKGDLSLLKNHLHLAVVGSRQYNHYGEDAIHSFFPKLIENKFVIVSGLAAGIDKIAHETAIHLKGKTIGVIAGGLYHVYPQESRKLSVEMMKNHLIISEYPPDTRPVKWQFPMRNRIISGICKGTFVVQAKSKSGSLITANYAVQEGREVFALPGNVFSPYCAGTNELIQQGAKLVKSSEDIIEELIY
ncbi:DNA-processing protein DprA [Bacillus sp. DTU_2020_1000418_1_SI_GHA_SEK_038]|uniref:DNA-processing protein DprA n=1 Tax=Bacillus sp. DTU_2020_1000418_1_SI_GHA_SEK_038 TaxID=3077585 RepID=UPI0028E470A8|nr:DNA-processing protein DprA [Bacillus sp. DTU_2020_1000418_1_SI_GHA_SEK_038]WNS77161.1 DNA-processing protein DprA [Bacillus sp. DTU_2020_1000418_1_SI_GHA_SEK_038]